MAIRKRSGAVLLEIVLSLVLFYSASTIILAGLHSAVLSIGNLKLEAQANDLLVTLMSRLQIGDLELSDAGPNAFEDETGQQEYLADWTWQVVTSQMQDTITGGGPTGVLAEVLVVYKPQEYKYRLSQWIATDENGQVLTPTSQPATPATAEGEGGT